MMDTDRSASSRLTRRAVLETSADLREKFPPYISPEDVRELSQLAPAISLSSAALEWLSIIVAIWLSIWSHHVVVYILSVIWIGSRMLALGILMHDAAHYRILKSKRWNDIVAVLFLAWPLFIDLENYRRLHFAHHRYVNSPRDPDRAYKIGTDDWDFPMRWQKLAMVFLMSLFGLDTIKRLSQLRRYITEPSGPRVIVQRIVFYLVVAALISYFQLWGVFLLYWLVPVVTWLNFTSRLREIAEHSAIPDKVGYLATRTYFVSLFARLFLAPNHVNYHIEHHLYPSVPFYRLPKVHALLMSQSEFTNNAHLTRSYWGLLRECIGLGDEKAAQAA